MLPTGMGLGHANTVIIGLKCVTADEETVMEISADGVITSVCGSNRVVSIN